MIGVAFDATTFVMDCRIAEMDQMNEFVRIKVKFYVIIYFNVIIAKRILDVFVCYVHIKSMSMNKILS